jgi:hypothetical protein
MAVLAVYAPCSATGAGNPYLDVVLARSPATEAPTLCFDIKEETMAYRVDGWKGIAWYRRKPTRDGRAFMTMIGDDRIFEVDADDVHKIDDKDYCSECGQIGCRCDGREH